MKFRIHSPSLMAAAAAWYFASVVEVAIVVYSLLCHAISPPIVITA